MAHDHSGNNHVAHGHNHNRVNAITSLNKAFIWGIVLNLAYVFIQAIVGWRINSLSLLSDAGHNFLDVAGLVLAMIAFKLSRTKSTPEYTYGYKKSSILISLLNAIILLISIGAIGYESILRFQHPEPLPGKTIAIIAAIGIVINSASALMFFRDRKSDINVKAAFLHLAADALVSLGLVAGGIIIYYTKLYWIDPLLSLVICFVIIANTWSLLRDSLRLSLDGVPDNVDVQKVKEKVKGMKGVREFYHLHIWAISTTENALTAHLIVNPDLSGTAISVLKKDIRHELEHLNIQHITLETEIASTTIAGCSVQD